MISRRRFLKATGAGVISAAALPALQQMLAARASAASESGFTLVTTSRAATINGVQHYMFLGGSGSFSPSHVEGGGDCYLHYDNAKASGRVLACGTWSAKGVVNYAPVGRCGPTNMFSGILDLEIELAQIVPSPLVRPARLRIVCNDPRFAAPSTGQPDGVTLEVPATPFVSGEAGGPFLPLQPVIGLTMLSGGALESGALSRAWEEEFQKVHGRTPTPQDRGDRIWSLDFNARHGRGPSEAEWVARWTAVNPK